MDKYDVIGKLGDGTYGVVLRAVLKRTGETVAIKRMKQKFRTFDECTRLPEVMALRKLHSCTSVVRLREIFREPSGELSLVFDFMDSDLLAVIRRHKQIGIPAPRIRSMCFQVVQGLAALHKLGYFHRDMKPENILVKKSAAGVETLKLADLGLIKEIRARPPFTDYVSTRWYRAPEILLQDKAYNSPVDVWAMGCILVELFTGRPLFPGSNEQDQLFKIVTLLGAPTAATWGEGLELARKLGRRFPMVTPTPLAQVFPTIPLPALDLIEKMLALNPRNRITAQQALLHPYLQGVDVAPEETPRPQLLQRPVAHTAPSPQPGAPVDWNDVVGRVTGATGGGGGGGVPSHLPAASGAAVPLAPPPVSGYRVTHNPVMLPSVSGAPNHHPYNLGGGSSASNGIANTPTARQSGRDVLLGPSVDVAKYATSLPLPGPTTTTTTTGLYNNNSGASPINRFGGIPSGQSGERPAYPPQAGLTGQAATKPAWGAQATMQRNTSPEACSPPPPSAAPQSSQQQQPNQRYGAATNASASPTGATTSLQQQQSSAAGVAVRRPPMDVLPTPAERIAAAAGKPRAGMGLRDSFENLFKAAGINVDDILSKLDAPPPPMPHAAASSSFAIGGSSPDPLAAGSRSTQQHAPPSPVTVGGGLPPRRVSQSPHHHPMGESPPQRGVVGTTTMPTPTSAAASGAVQYGRRRGSDADGASPQPRGGDRPPLAGVSPPPVTATTTTGESPLARLLGQSRYRTGNATSSASFGASSSAAAQGGGIDPLAATAVPQLHQAALAVQQQHVKPTTFKSPSFARKPAPLSIHVLQQNSAAASSGVGGGVPSFGASSSSLLFSTSHAQYAGGPLGAATERAAEAAVAEDVAYRRLFADDAPPPGQAHQRNVLPMGTHLQGVGGNTHAAQPGQGQQPLRATRLAHGSNFPGSQSPPV